MLSEVVNLLAGLLVNDPLSDYKLGSYCFRGGKSGILHFQDAVEISSGRPVSIISIHVKDIAARSATELETYFIVETFRNGFNLLTRLRHTCVLQVVRPLVEDEKRLRVVTERVSSLLNHELTIDKLSQQEKLLGLHRCASAIQFIHEHAGYLLLDFCPSAVCLVDGEWKLFDLSHAILGSTAPYLRMRYPFGGISAPLLDYCATEVVETETRRNLWGPMDLNMLKNTAHSPVQLPESDIFSFVLVVCEVLSGTKLFHCGGNASVHAAQLPLAESVVAKWFSHCVLISPRPSFASLLRERLFSSPDLRLLFSLEAYDTLDASARLRVRPLLRGDGARGERRAGSEKDSGGGKNEHGATRATPMLAPLLSSAVPEGANISRSIMEHTNVEETVLCSTQEKWNNSTPITSSRIPAEEADISFFKNTGSPMSF